MTFHRYDIRRLRLIGYLPLLLIVLSSCSDRSMARNAELHGDASLRAEHELPQADGRSPVFVRVLYDPVGRTFYFDARMFPATSFLTAYDVESAPQAWFAADATKVRRVDTLPEAVFDLKPRGGMFFSSSLLRSVGGSQHSQPFGRYVLTTSINEEAYEVKRRAGFPFFSSYTETLGDGLVRLVLQDGESGAEVFALEQEYQGNSEEYTAFFSPDGRFLLLLLPDHADSVAAQLPGHHRFMVIGPLDVDASTEEIISRLTQLKEEATRVASDREQRRRYADGEINAAEYFGEVYVDAVRKLRTCKSVQASTGQLHSLKLESGTLDFGNPDVVGKVFTFAFTADAGAGTMVVISLHPQFRETHGEQYRPYLESVDIRMGGPPIHVACDAYDHDG